MNKFIFRSALAIFSALSLSLASCGDDDDDPPSTTDSVEGNDSIPAPNPGGNDSIHTPNPDEKIPAGVFVINSGSFFSGVNGTLSFLDYSSNTLTDSLFVNVNGRTRGGTPNDIVLYGSKLYIAVTDENRIEIVDAHTLHSLSYIEQKQPRCLVAANGKVYASTYEGTVISVDTASLAKAATSEVVGSRLEGITAMGDYIYVCNAYNPDNSKNTNVVKLNAKSLSKVKDINVTVNPTRITNDGSNLYVQSTGNYEDISPCIQRVSVNNDSIETLCSGTYMAILNNKIYSVNSVYGQPSEYLVYDLATGKTSQFIDGSDIYCPCAIAADPAKGIIYISSYNEGAYGSADYAGRGYIVAYSADGTKLSKYNAGVGPIAFAFWQK